MNSGRCLGLSTLLIYGALTMGTGTARAEPGLLLIAHGAPRAEWNQPVLQFGAQVAEKVRASGRYRAVRTALMEFAQPDVPTAVAELEAAGCDRIVAVPLFVMPSGHTHFDVPAVLGIYTSTQTAATMAAEGARAAQPRVPILLTATMAEGLLLEEYALHQVRALSQKPQEESLVVLAHGDEEHHAMIERTLRRVTSHCCGQSGISYADWACVGVGQEFAARGVPAITRAAEARKRVLVVGLYLGSSAADISRRGRTNSQHGGVRPDPFEGQPVAFSTIPLVAYPGLLDWSVDAARRALEAPPAAAPARNASAAGGPTR